MKIYRRTIILLDNLLTVFGKFLTKYVQICMNWTGNWTLKEKRQHVHGKRHEATTNEVFASFLFLVILCLIFALICTNNALLNQTIESLPTETLAQRGCHFRNR